jgi:hypothetical protein
MTVWSCIEGTNHANREYAPLDIVQELKAIRDFLIPAPIIDDTVWSETIRRSRRSTVVPVEVGDPIRRAA